MRGCHSLCSAHFLPSPKPHACALREAKHAIIPPSTAKIQILANMVLYFAVYDQHPAQWDESCNEHLKHLILLSRPDGRAPSR